MSALEIRLLAYGLLAFLVIGGAGIGGYELAAHHYQRIMAIDQIAQQNAVIAANEKTQAIVAQQQAASVAAEKRYEDLQTSASTLGDELTRSLREYASLRDRIVSASSHAPSGAHAAGEGTSGARGLAGMAGQAAEACEQDANELTALQLWARSISEKTP